MTEAWEEFQFRAAVGEQLAKKDATGDGFVCLAELDEPASVPPANPGPADLSAVLEMLGMPSKAVQSSIRNAKFLQYLRHNLFPPRSEACSPQHIRILLAGLFALLLALHILRQGRHFS